MGTMMKKLLVIITTAMVCGGYHISKIDIDNYEDLVLKQCVITRNGYVRPLIHPSECKDVYSQNMCALLYPVTEADVQNDSDDHDYMVSSRCYEGLITDSAVNCISKCANCCETPKFNCSNVKPDNECDIISQLGLCSAPGMEDFVSYFCRQTCGVCEQAEFNKSICDDENQDECQQLFGMVPCTVPYMYKNCRRTCFITDDNGCRSDSEPSEVASNSNEDITSAELIPEPEPELAVNGDIANVEPQSDPEPSEVASDLNEDITSAELIPEPEPELAANGDIANVEPQSDPEPSEESEPEPAVNLNPLLDNDNVLFHYNDDNNDPSYSNNDDYPTIGPAADR